jgi:SAM-dependent methyltransferase
MSEESAGHPWHDDDALWEAVGPHLFSAERLEAAPGEAARAADLLGLPPGAAVLDLGCGPGRHALALARLGYRVTGVDRTRAYLDRARAAAEAEGLEVEWVRSDMREFRRDGAFDATVNMLTTFGYFEDPEDDRRVLRNVLASLCPGGELLVETIGKEVIARIFEPRAWEEADDGALWLFEREVDRDWSWMRNRWIRVHEGERREWRVEHRLFAGTELADWLAAAGFEQCRVYGSLDGAPYDNEAERLVVVGRRPGGAGPGQEGERA